MQLGKYGKNAGWGVLAVAAVLYGTGVAFGEPLWGADFANVWVLFGSALLGITFLAVMVVPFFIWLSRNGRAAE